MPLTVNVGQRVQADVELTPEGPSTLVIEGFVVDEFLTPVQRARYWGMQEQLRRQMEEMRERRGDGSRTEREKGRRRP